MIARYRLEVMGFNIASSNFPIFLFERKAANGASRAVKNDALILLPPITPSYLSTIPLIDYCYFN